MTEPTKAVSAAGHYEATLDIVRFPKCRLCGASQEIIWKKQYVWVQGKREVAPPVPEPASTECQKCGTRFPRPTDRRHVRAINWLTPVSLIGGVLLSVGQWLRRKGESL